MSRDESSGTSVVGRALEEVFRTTSVIGGGWDSDLAVEPSPNALGNVLHFDYDHIGCCSKVKIPQITIQTCISWIEVCIVCFMYLDEVNLI